MNQPYLIHKTSAGWVIYDPTSKHDVRNGNGQVMAYVNSWGATALCQVYQLPFVFGEPPKLEVS